MHIFLQDLLFSACGLSILSTIICTLSTVTCSIHIFSLDLVHLVSADSALFILRGWLCFCFFYDTGIPLISYRDASRIQDITFKHKRTLTLLLWLLLSSPLIAPGPSTQSAPLHRMPSWPTSWTLRSLSPQSLHLPTIPLNTHAAPRQMPRGTNYSTIVICNLPFVLHAIDILCKFNTHFQRITNMFVSSSSITYNGSMESPVPLYPTDCPPPYESVMGQRAASQVSITMYTQCNLKVWISRKENH